MQHSRVQEACGHAVHQLHHVSMPHGSRRAAHLQLVPGETQAGCTVPSRGAQQPHPRRDRGSECSHRATCTLSEVNSCHTKHRRSVCFLEAKVMWFCLPRSHSSCSVLSTNATVTDILHAQKSFSNRRAFRAASTE